MRRTDRVFGNRIELVVPSFNRWNWKRCTYFGWIEPSQTWNVDCQSHVIKNPLLRHHKRVCGFEKVWVFKFHSFNQNNNFFSFESFSLVSGLVDAVEFNLTITFVWVILSLSVLCFGVQVETVKLTDVKFFQVFFFSMFLSLFFFFYSINKLFRWTKVRIHSNCWSWWSFYFGHSFRSLLHVNWVIGSPFTLKCCKMQSADAVGIYFRPKCK